MNDLSRNEAIAFIAKQEFPGYGLLKRTRSKGREARQQLGEGEQEVTQNIAGYIRKLRCLPLAEIIVLQSAADKKYSERIAAEKLRRLEASKQKDEERFFNLPSQQADFEFWAKMDHWKDDEAVALTFGRNPNAVNWNYVYPYTNISPFAKEYEKRLKLVRRACRSGTLIWPIAPIHFLRWAGIKGISCPDELVSLVSIYNSTESMKDSKDMSEVSEKEECEVADGDCLTFQEAAEKQFDPLPIRTIAKIFKINPDSKKNEDTWVNYARYAEKNGLAVARSRRSEGRGKSDFDPVEVGEWLVKKGLMEPAEVYRHLGNNLPKRSEHLKDYYLQPLTTQR